MRLHRAWFLIMALLLAIGLPVAALAGGWSTVTPDSPPGSLTAGNETTIGFTVLQHGRTPLVDQQPKVTFTNTATGASTLVIAYPEGAPGHYVAKVTLNQAGAWSWVVDVFEGPHPMADLAVAAAPTPSEAPAPAPAADRLALAGGAALAVVLGLVFVSVLRRSRSGQLAR